MRYLLALIVTVIVAQPIGATVAASLDDSVQQITVALDPEGTP